jgi:hypothetical protein
MVMGQDIPWQPSATILRQFAALWLVLVGGLAVRSVGISHPLTLLAGAIGVAGLMRPGLVRWLFVGLVLVTYPVGRAVSWLLLGMLFFVVLTPLAMVFRVLGRDPLQLRRLAGADQSTTERDTCWLPRPAERPPASYFRQF